MSFPVPREALQGKRLQARFRDFVEELSQDVAGVKYNGDVPHEYFERLDQELRDAITEFLIDQPELTSLERFQSEQAEEGAHAAADLDAERAAGL